MISTALPAEGHGLQCNIVVESIIPYGLNIPKMAMDMIQLD
jgi:hypothetical protein